MQGAKTVGTYRAIDCTLFAVILAVFETVVVKAGIRWFPQEPWMVSVTPVIVAIVLMRWGPWAAIHAVLGGAVLCWASGAMQQQPLMLPVYCAGNLGGLAGLLLLKKPGGERIRGDSILTIVFGAVVLLGMQAGRALVSLIVIRDVGALPMFFLPETVTMLFTLVLMWIVRRVDGLFENQIHYLKRYRQQAETDGYGNAEDKGGFQ